jgi:adenylate cyclase
LKLDRHRRHVFTTGEPLLILDPYSDPRFNSSIDEQTGFVTRNIVCVPIRTVKGEIIGVAQSLNKRKGDFTTEDLDTLAAMTTQGTMALQGAVFIERMKALRAQEIEFVEIVSEVTADIKLGSLLQRVMGEATRLLNAERSTLFLNDEKTNELWSEVGQGLQSIQIRFPTTAASPAPSSRRGNRSISPTPTPTCGSTRVRQADGILHPLDPVRADHQQGGHGPSA